MLLHNIDQTVEAFMTGRACDYKVTFFIVEKDALAQTTRIYADSNEEAATERSAADSLQ